MAIFGSNGQPAEGLGADGDFAFDYKNRIFFGPKGNSTAGSWASTANSVQGPAGLGLLTGSGSPSPNIGQTGNGYLDVATGNLWSRGASGWAQGATLNNQFSPILQGSGPPNASTAPAVQVGQMYFDTTNKVLYGPSTSASASGLTQSVNVVGAPGAAGPQGFSSLTQFALGAGSFAIANGITLSSTPQALTIAGTTMPLYFTPTSASAFLGAYFYQAGSACTVALYDVTAGSVVYSYSLGTASIGVGVFAATAYSLVANHVYQWQVSGSGTATFQLNPYYLLPNGSTNAGSGILQGFTSASGTALSGTVQYLGPGAKTNTSSAYVRGFGVIRTGAVASAQGLFVPSATGAASATCTFTLYGYNGSSQSAVTTFTATNNGLPQTTVFSSPVTLTTGVNYYIGVTGSGTGQVDAQLSVIT